MLSMAFFLPFSYIWSWKGGADGIGLQVDEFREGFGDVGWQGVGVEGCEV